MQNRATLKSIQAFEAAARLSSFALAAEELFVTPSAISHQVKLLEEQLGVRLVSSRASRGDAHGHRPQVRRGDRRGVRAHRGATRDIGRVAKSDILTVHSTPSFATQWLMSRLARFSALNPDIDVRLNASTEVCDLTTGVGRYRDPLWRTQDAARRHDGAGVAAGNDRAALLAGADAGRASDPRGRGLAAPCADSQ